MTGIDSVAAALLASRLDSLLTGGVASAAAGGAAAQVGTPGAGVAPSSEAGGALPQPPAASTQTALSDVARVLDAIARTGGDATPAVVGRMPLVPDPAALFAAAADGAAGQSGHAAAASASSAAKAAAAEAAPPSLAGALRAALAQAVGESGLFYESHLAQWFAGQRPLAALLREPQARIAIAQTSADPDAAPDDDALDALLTPRLSLASARAAVQPGAVASGAAASGGAPSGGARPAGSAPEPMPGAQPHPPLARAAADATDPLHELADWRASVARPADAAPSDAAPPTPVHPAAVPIVRQQLDTLATDQFRWTGEAWPGVRVDWTIEPDESGGHAPRSDDDAGDGIAWRTRLTLTLPTLGTVDAELVLNGAQLVARLRANQAGAARLAQHEPALRRRFEGSGLQLGGLSIRAVDEQPEAFDVFAAQVAASAYAHAAAGGATAPVPPVPPDDGALR
ncbi:flagellar hook-length control protein FliK [Burkholderia multivorans]|uniref:flagellar hook-length control protein FliK n=2 Tax=Burkholderia multivorans TaxID=87883 RepID=UPI0012DE9AA3|nr:flagellar hook-length control protein FliK [Burkholderia multivorans]MBN6730391.1 flagellar hook-length control protein FliK [Burkholderia multivorans]MBN6736110.1 flagellar hook-length control protein FliK [Burkholderia multivorans]MBN7128284.1 flagellar hook-length control protein FliK [Burkholderia multivorans]MBN8163875.1 flagellar hook-length control protein FliK [Burkholderia multivorans]MBN8168727.1 flagellar hook-length control protein FliK [Burkholderia multivorans]